jgi:SWI/SNF-related matrix-associated actin-dependent regulator of chromatin subfamily A member 5
MYDAPNYTNQTGKTLQTISFITFLLQEKKLKGPHLVVVPLSVLSVWINEFAKFSPSVKVQRVYSTNTEEQTRLRSIVKDRSVQVIVTTYDILKRGGLTRVLHSVNWRTVILDEGHHVKNDETAVSKACYSLKARFKLILTGTPVQNNLREAYAMLHFLQPHIFIDPTPFESIFNLSGMVQVDREMLNKAHYLMRIYVLRRLKSEVEQKLPPKLETKINCPMTDMQLFWVKQLLFKDRDVVSRIMSSDPSAKRFEGDAKRLTSLMAQLRKAANHPYLFPGAEVLTIDGRPTEEIVTASGKMIILDSLLKRLFLRKHRVVIFSQFTRTLDIISDYFDMRGIRSCRLDGSTNRVMREVSIKTFNKPNSPINVFLLSTRAGGEGVNLITADTVILFDSDWNIQVSYCSIC